MYRANETYPTASILVSKSVDGVDSSVSERRRFVDGLSIMSTDDETTAIGWFVLSATRSLEIGAY